MISKSSQKTENVVEKHNFAVCMIPFGLQKQNDLQFFFKNTHTPPTKKKLVYKHYTQLVPVKLDIPPFNILANFQIIMF